MDARHPINIILTTVLYLINYLQLANRPSSHVKREHFASEIRLKVIILMNETTAHLFKVGVRDVFLKSGINR